MFSSHKPLGESTKAFIDLLLLVVDANIHESLGQAAFPAVVKISEKLNSLLSSKPYTMDEHQPDDLANVADSDHSFFDDFYK